MLSKLQFFGIFPAPLDTALTRDRKLKAQLSIVRNTALVPFQETRRGRSQGEFNGSGGH